MENSCQLLDFFYDFSKLYQKAFFSLPVERLVLNKKSNGSGCHQLFPPKEKQRSCTHSCQHVSLRYNFEISAGIKAARPLLSNSLPKTYADGAVGETTGTEQKHLKVACMKVGYLAHFLPTISYSLLLYGKFRSVGMGECQRDGGYSEPRREECKQQQQNTAPNEHKNGQTLWRISFLAFPMGRLKQWL